MIKRFQVRNYEALRGVAVDMTPIQVLIGPNDSGKTSILEAIAALCRSVDYALDQDGQKLTLAYNTSAKSLRVVKAEWGIQWMYAFWFAWYAFHSDTELYAFPVGKLESPAEESQKRVERFQSGRE